MWIHNPFDNNPALLRYKIGVKNHIEFFDYNIFYSQMTFKLHKNNCPSQIFQVILVLSFLLMSVIRLSSLALGTDVCIVFRGFECTFDGAEELCLLLYGLGLGFI